MFLLYAIKQKNDNENYNNIIFYGKCLLSICIYLEKIAW